ncbi:MAG: helix-turn-helix domain-containing protein [Actinobacteria bacterium]|nr:helix-turn-helix domain-containing protein [Actinomycetota bacterium]MCL5882720.1 helix-turn-helix domain-containing protein [Actinomycetota bacterium]
MLQHESEKWAFSIEEVAQLLGIGRNTAYEMCRIGRIPTVKLGRRKIVPRKALEKLLSSEESMKDDKEL